MTGVEPPVAPSPLLVACCGVSKPVVCRVSSLVVCRMSSPVACRVSKPVACRVSHVISHVPFFVLGIISQLSVVVTAWTRDMRHATCAATSRLPARSRVACHVSRVACRSSRVITCRARISPCKMTNRRAPTIASITGGGGGIRTPGGVAPTQPFQGCTIDHSDTPPQSTFVRTSGMVPGAGLEPARTHVQQILSLPRLPLRHPGGSTVLERAKGIEPSWPAWKAGTLPLSYARLTYERHKVYHFRGKSSMANLRQ